MKWFDSGLLSPFRNMAIDEALFIQKIPALRFYGWNQRAFSIGYFQEFNPKNFDAPVVRRMTGGGIVEHGRDLTFSIILDLKTLPSLDSVKNSYHWIHQIILKALMNLDISTKFYSSAKEEKGNLCFVSPSRDDLIWEGLKIVGGAQRRKGNFLLHQGTIALDKIFLKRSLLIQQIVKNFESAFQLDLKEGCDVLSNLEENIKILGKKYDSLEWTRERQDLWMIQQKDRKCEKV